MIGLSWLLALTSGCVVKVVIPDGHLAEEDTAATDPCAHATIDPAAGGTLALGDISLTFPAGAVSAATDLSLCPADAPTGYTLMSQVVVASPAVDLAIPITATLPRTGLSTAIYAPDAT